MPPKNLKILKIGILICFPLIVLGIGYSSFSGKKEIIEMNATPNSDTASAPVDLSTSRRDSIVNYAMKLLGTPYMAGACSADGFDCSGFVHYVFRHFNLQVPRSSSQFQNYGKTVSLDHVKKGDILVFLSPTRNVIGHVGIVTKPMGKSTEFIHSSSGSEMKVIISSMKLEGYKVRFVKAVNVL